MSVETSLNTTISPPTIQLGNSAVPDSRSVAVTPSSVSNQNLSNHNYNIGTSFDDYGPGLKPSPRKNGKVVKQLLLNSASSPPQVPQTLQSESESKSEENFLENDRIEIFELPTTELGTGENNTLDNKQALFNDQDLLELQELLETHKQVIAENERKNVKISKLNDRLAQEEKKTIELEKLLEKKTQTVLQLEKHTVDLEDKCKHFKMETQKIGQSVEALRSLASKQNLELKDDISKLQKLLDSKVREVSQRQLLVYDSELVKLRNTFESLMKEQSNLYKSEIARLKLENDELKQENSNTNSNSNERFESLLSGLTLYGRELSEPIKKFMEETKGNKNKNKNKKSGNFELEKLFQGRYPDITGFMTSETKLALCSSKNNSEEKQIRKYIEKTLRSQLETSTLEQQRLIKKLIDEMKQLHSTTTITFIDSLKREEQEKEQDLKRENEKIELIRQNEELKGRLLEIKEQKLLDERQKFSQEMFDELTRLNSENRELLEVSIPNYLLEIERLLNSLENYEQKTLNLERRLKCIEGNQTARLTFDKLVAMNASLTMEQYQYLGCEYINSLTNVELGNIVKELMVLLEVPYFKLRRKIPLIAIYLKYERNLYGYFANRLHYSRFNNPIDSKRLTQEAFTQYQRTGNIDGIVHPLEECLENLYNDYTLLNRDFVP